MPTSQPTEPCAQQLQQPAPVRTIRRPHSRTLESNSLDIRRIQRGRITRAKSTPTLSYSEIHQQRIWEAAQLLQHPARPADCYSEPDQDILQGTSEISSFDGRFTTSELPAFELTSQAPFLSVGNHAAISADHLTSDFFNFSDIAFLPCSSEAEVLAMTSGYSRDEPYHAASRSGYDNAESTQDLKPPMPAHASPPALTYAPSHSSSPPTVSASPAISQTSSAATRPSHGMYYPPPASLASYDPRTASAQGYQQPLGSPYAASYYPYSSYYPTSTPHAQQAASYGSSVSGYFQPATYATHNAQTHPSYSPGYYAEGAPKHEYPQSAAASHSVTPMPEAANTYDRARQPAGEAICHEHGCNGRVFSTFSNLLRHQRERSGTAMRATCPHCGASFTRTTARNGHLKNGICGRRSRAAGGEISDHSSDERSSDVGGDITPPP